VRVASYTALRARTSRSESEEGALFPIPGLLSGDPVRNDREEGELNLAARASGEGRICQMGSKIEMTLATESFILLERLEV
jgi:hypothetical protein